MYRYDMGSIILEAGSLYTTTANWANTRIHELPLPLVQRAPQPAILNCKPPTR